MLWVGHPTTGGFNICRFDFQNLVWKLFVIGVLSLLNLFLPVSKINLLIQGCSILKRLIMVYSLRQEFQRKLNWITELLQDQYSKKKVRCELQLQDCIQISSWGNTSFSKENSHNGGIFGPEFGRPNRYTSIKNPLDKTIIDTRCNTMKISGLMLIPLKFLAHVRWFF